MKSAGKNKVIDAIGAASIFNAPLYILYAPAFFFAPCVFKYSAGEDSIELRNNDYANTPAEIETAAFKTQAPA
jgi:hypothetical protein